MIIQKGHGSSHQTLAHQMHHTIHSILLTCYDLSRSKEIEIEMVSGSLRIHECSAGEGLIITYLILTNIIYRYENRKKRRGSAKQ